VSLLRPHRPIRRPQPPPEAVAEGPREQVRESFAGAGPPAPAPAAPEPDPCADVPPLYRGGARLLDWKNTARSGMTVDFGIRDEGPMGVHPFKGLRTGKEGGQRFRVSVRLEPDVGVDPADLPAVYEGEGLLMRWSDDCMAGMTVRFLLDDGPDGTAGVHPFEGMATGRKEGEALALSAWALADDESTQHPRHVRRKTPFWELSEVKQSQILCRDARFVSFLAENEAVLAGGAVLPRPEEDPIKFAGSVVKAYLRVESRGIMNLETAEAAIARRRWEALMKEYFRNGYR